MPTYFIQSMLILKIRLIYLLPRRKRKLSSPYFMHETREEIPTTLKEPIITLSWDKFKIRK